MVNHLLRADMSPRYFTYIMISATSIQRHANLYTLDASVVGLESSKLRVSR